jgi:hypothetical protein
MPDNSVVLVIQELKKWLGKNYGKIASFWLYADWRNWAHYDLYAHLMKVIAKYETSDRARGLYHLAWRAHLGR